MNEPKIIPNTGNRGKGRPKGAPNKKTQQLQERVASEGITPLDYMLAMMRDATNDKLERFEAAKAAAPYVHAKLSSTEVKGDPDSPLSVTGLAVTFVKANASEG